MIIIWTYKLSAIDRLPASGIRSTLQVLSRLVIYYCCSVIMVILIFFFV